MSTKKNISTTLHRNGKICSQLDERVNFLVRIVNYHCFSQNSFLQVLKLPHRATPPESFLMSRELRLLVKTRQNHHTAPPVVKTCYNQLGPFPKTFAASIFVGNLLLHAVVGGQPLLERLRKLFRELCPALFPDLVLETVQDLAKHILQVRLGVIILSVNRL